MSTITVGSLFSGIGGLDLGLERAGMEIRWQVENNGYCSRILEKHWPGIKRYGDIRSIDWSSVERVDLVCGGFPCQPVSNAGKQKGDRDPRWLWPEFVRCLCEVQPGYAVVENVPGLLSAQGGRLAGKVFGDLAGLGYDAQWGIVSASDVGAPHLRRRVFILAYAQRLGLPRPSIPIFQRESREENAYARREGAEMADSEGSGVVGRDGFTGDATFLDGFGKDDQGRISGYSAEKDLADSNGSRFKKQGWAEPVQEKFNSIERDCKDVSDSEGSEREGPLSSWAGRAGTSRGRPRGGEDHWPTEPDICRVVNGIPNQLDRIRCLGNAVVPQVAEAVGRFVIEIVGAYP
jgi:DNA (cytosine-5)-methyltransferase 1